MTTPTSACYADVKSLYDAYLALLSGKQRIRVRYNDMWTEYRQTTAGDMDRLRELYQTLRLQCPDALANLPDLNPAMRVRRGPAVGVIYK